MATQATGSDAARRAVASLFAAAALLALLLASTRWFDVVAGGLVPMLQALSPYASLAALVLGAGALLVSRRLRFAQVVAVLVTVDVAAALLFTRGAAAPESEQGEGDLSILSANVGLGRADPDALLEAAVGVDADVVVLLEADAHFVAALDAAGAATQYPYRVVGSAGAPDATAVLSRVRFEQVDAPAGTEFEAVAVRLEGSGMTVLGAHPAPPLPGLADAWRSDLTRVDAWARGHDGPLVVAGDFNATTAHPGFRRLCSGSGGLRGCGSVLARPTWAPSDGWPDLLRLDHVLTRGVSASDGGVLDLPGSDHAAVWRRLAVDAT